MATKKQPEIDRRKSLEGVLVLNRNVELERRDDGNLTLVVVKQRGAGFLARFQPAVMRKQYKLDELGTFCVEQIDGHRTALQIINAFVHRFKLNRREAELSVVEFVRQLMRRNAISILID